MMSAITNPTAMMNDATTSHSDDNPKSVDDDPLGLIFPFILCESICIIKATTDCSVCIISSFYSRVT
jgi:hypothetical protein